MKRYILGGVALMVTVTAVTAATTAAPLAPSATKPLLFEKVDINGDGSISIKEAAVINLTNKQFKLFDLNKDGLLSKVEYEASMVDKTS